ncbi:MAG: TetR/AcrR family transcriptional regulator [Nitrospinae bacterium]|nr:TetR/AcrR family transcriptional regulator [Nitrospinota bacterium]
MKKETKPALRETKFAKTKLSLLEAALALIRQKPFDEIAVAELCQMAEVSYATFFNYFGKKNDLLVYFIQLWSVEVAWHARQVGAKSGGLAAIEEIFDYTARQCEEGPEIMGEIIALMARRRPGSIIKPPPLTEAEKWIRFPHIEGFKGLGDMGLESILPPLITAAVNGGELPSSTDTTAVLEALASIFLGVPVALAAYGPGNYKDAYRRQLQTLWAGIRSINKVDKRRNKS